MADLATVRSEIKAWERTFKESNGKTPTVDDIKQNPAIANKYKLYKKLSKAAASSNLTQTIKAASPPSTPPRTSRLKDPTSLLLSKSRSVQPSVPLAAFNPFSPQKKKGKEKEKANYDKIHESQSNPFGKADPSTHGALFPSTQASSSSSLSLNQLPAPGSAVSRARKRLRGEPVSPSPNKDKRRRVASQTSLPFPRLNLSTPSSDEAEGDLMEGEGDSSFVGDSPMKLPTAGKSYTQLFEEKPISVDLFGAKAKPVAAKQDHQSLRNKSNRSLGINGLPKPAARRPSSSNQTPGNSSTSDLERINFKSNLPSRLNDKDASSSEASSARSSAKRVFSDEDNENEAPKARPKSPLIPPSPPPPDTSSSFNRTGKIKTKTLDGGGRKKVKVDEARVESGSEDAELREPPTKLKIVKRRDMRRRQATTEGNEDEDAVLSDPDPIFGYARFAGPHVSSHQPVDADEGTVEIDLPDELRRVLALETAASKGNASEEKRILQGLLYGRRAHHYDPHKGGEIWDVGEDYNVDENNTANTEDEEDWEGEPIPWEAGEL